MRVRTLIFLIALAFAWGACTNAAYAQSVPVLKGRVTDTAGVLSSAEQVRLSKLLADYEDETHHQLAVLTITTLSGEPLEKYSPSVANTWGLGYRGVDNGILIILAMKERKVRIELGKGMERYISDAEAKAIIDDTMTPAFARGDFAGGLEQGLKRLMADARRFVVNPSELPRR
jgi:uncharacterized protein